jgi:hypothetical protein
MTSPTYCQYSRGFVEKHWKYVLDRSMQVELRHIIITLVGRVQVHHPSLNSRNLGSNKIKTGANEKKAFTLYPIGYIKRKDKYIDLMPKEGIGF